MKMKYTNHFWPSDRGYHIFTNLFDPTCETQNWCLDQCSIAKSTPGHMTGAAGLGPASTQQFRSMYSSLTPFTFHEPIQDPLFSTISTLSTFRFSPKIASSQVIHHSPSTFSPISPVAPHLPLNAMALLGSRCCQGIDHAGAIAGGRGQAATRRIKTDVQDLGILQVLSEKN